MGDFDDRDSLRRALEGVSRVFLTSADGPDKVAHETALIDAAAETGVDLIVKLSAMNATDHPELPAFGWHRQIETHLGRSGVPAVVLQPSFFMTNLLMVAAGVAHTGTLYAPTGGAKVSMIDVRDVAASAAVVLTTDGHGGRSYVLTGPEAITFDDVAAALADATGRPVRYADLSAEEARPRFEAAGLPQWLLTQLTGVFDLVRDGLFAQTTNQVEAITGHVPRSIDEFARSVAEAFRP